MFSKNLEITLNTAFAQAREKRYEFITVEHLLLALLDDPDANAVLRSCGANIERLRVGLGIYIDQTPESGSKNARGDVQPNLSFQRVLQRAIYQAQSTGRNEVTGANVLAAIFGEQDTQAVYFLTQENVSRLDVINYITQGMAKRNFENGDPFSGGSMQQPGMEGPEREGHASEEGLLELYTTNLNEKARSGRTDPLVGRDAEIKRSIQILCRRSKNNALLVGEAGVGKTAIAEGLAQYIVDGKVPANIRHCTVYSLDLGVLVAGTKYRGDFEKRFKAVLKALSRNTGAIIFIDEIHNLVGAGSATGGTMDAANLIKPLLSSNEIRCIGATTYDEFRNFFSKDQALLRRFQKVDVVEPSHDETLQMLRGLKSRYERYHSVSYNEEALQRTVELSSRYLPDRHLPDKAFDIIDEAGAYQQLLAPAERKTLITPLEIEHIVARMARIPVEQLTTTDKQQIQQLPIRLQQLVFGQDEAIHTLTNAIKLSRSGLRDVNKPVGSFLLAGPTGVGKTEVTKQLANVLGIDFIRFDMSEYMERHAVSRLIGAPPGYVGYDQGGLLTEAILKKPHAVLLLDEIEKAHPDIFNVLLQVMDYGRLTDNNGRVADFRHIILVMTTNAGAERMEKNQVGFSETHEAQDGSLLLRSLFTPEFRNRLDSIVTFKHLEPTTIQCVVDKNLGELTQQLAGKNVELVVTPTAKTWLATRGYDRKMGARPMARLIQERLKLPLADELLFGGLSQENGGQVNVCVVDDELKLEITPNTQLPAADQVSQEAVE